MAKRYRTEEALIQVLTDGEQDSKSDISDFELLDDGNEDSIDDSSSSGDDGDEGEGGSEAEMDSSEEDEDSSKEDNGRQIIQQNALHAYLICLHFVGSRLSESVGILGSPALSLLLQPGQQMKC